MVGRGGRIRRGGFDRIVVPEPWAAPIEELCRAGAGGAVYAHEVIRVGPGRAPVLFRGLHEVGRSCAAALGVTLIGGFRVAMADDAEAVVLWSFPDWATWRRYEQEWHHGGGMGPWRSALIDIGAQFHRELLVDAPLAPLRTGRQPDITDRLPLDQV